MQILHRAGLSPAFPHRAGCMGRPTGNRKDLRTGVRHKIDLHTHSRRNEQRLQRATLYPTRTRSGRNQRQGRSRRSANFGLDSLRQKPANGARDGKQQSLPPPQPKLPCRIPDIRHRGKHGVFHICGRKWSTPVENSRNLSTSVDKGGFQGRWVSSPISARPLHWRVAGKAMANDIKPIVDQRHHGDRGPKRGYLPPAGGNAIRPLSPALANRPPPTKNDTYRPPPGMLMRFSS